jgi:hypothetical protein
MVKPLNLRGASLKVLGKILNRPLKIESGFTFSAASYPVPGAARINVLACKSSSSSHS